jgi:hypothetical protein
MDTFKIKRGDTSPALRFALSPASVNLTAASVVFNMRHVSGTVKLNRKAASIITATGTPTVEYEWATDDTDTAGLYQAEFEVTYNDATRETFPNGDFITVLITGDIA